MDKEKKPNPNQEGTPSRSEKQAPASTTWKGFLSKKWFFPAVYLGAAALILALIVWYQAAGPTKDLSIEGDDLRPEIVDGKGDPFNNPVLPVTSQEETLSWPIAREANATIVMGFYDDKASAEEQARAVMQMGKEFYPSTGISLAIDGNTSFDVMAAAAGQVIRADYDQLVGYVVHIKHQNLTTIYQSLQDLTVAVGDQVEQGDVIGKAGRNAVSKDLGVHVHFEVRNANDEPTNPLASLPAQN